MDIEWAKDGLSGDLFILQARPETIHRGQNKKSIQVYQLKTKSKVLVEGKAVGEKVAQGKVRIIQDLQQMDQFQPGEVLVIEKTDPDWEPVIKKAAAIVTDRGGEPVMPLLLVGNLGYRQ
ncbi:pyruvate phosphate dikinase-like enzyme [Methylacidiphilum kamchatkense Kam1]|uniref:Phosphoenolpyruvate synthase n=1 Tax=Methylacidiphilum kamchatkense Kam1 TaxID=1202785 RepID=A0A516TMV7_9BACT|nr:pyruvate phosphate dikinase-like enzyme [Methylacidiphilum kamchatkense Kam1]